MTAADLVLSAAYALFAALSIFLAVHDVRTHRLPNVVVLPAYPVLLALVAVSALLAMDGARLVGALLGMVLLFAFYLALRLLSARGMGGGDVKLAGIIGVMLGATGWGAIALGTLAGFVLGGLYGVILLATRRAHRRTAIPFGPWMLLGAWVGILCGPALGGAALSSGL